MTSQNVNQRKAAERQRKRAAGLVQVEVWIRPEQKPELKRLVAQLTGGGAGP